ncbi:MAG: hypothetical protein K0S76_1025 [Herbinix sp.]|jgi:hypothetical protein|nr:hypothetical protein [Herbinix sp.]
MNDVIIVAIITGSLSLAGTLAGSYFSQRKSAALISYRLEQLEDKVHKHNNLIERTYKLEERCTLQDEKMKVANHRLDDLEREKVS